MNKIDSPNIGYGNFNKKIEKMSKTIKKRFSDEINVIQEMWDIEERLFLENSFYNMYLTGMGIEYSIVITAIYKNLVSAFSALKLTNKGLFGPARSLLRTGFEFLIIAKYCSLTQDENIIKLWESETEDNIGIQIKSIYPKFIKPTTKSFKDFFKLLHKFSHATKFSQQIHFDIKLYPKEIIPNVIYTYRLIQGLLECNYHLINTCLENKSVNYYQSVYGTLNDKELMNKIKKYKTRMNIIFKRNKKIIDNELKSFIYNFKLKWKLK